MTDPNPTTHPVQNGEELRVYLDTYRGRHSLHVRRWWKDAAGELKPGKGAAVPVHLLPWLRLALERAETEAIERGLLDEEAYELVGLAVPARLIGGRP